jgi:hypothetical protein
MEKKTSSMKLLLYQSVGFLAIIALSWADELLGLRSLVLGDHPYISDFRESTLEMLFILAVWLIVFGSTRRLLEHTRYLEGFKRVCAWCRRIDYKGRWMPLEEFMAAEFDARTTHGICRDCSEKLEAQAESKSETENPREAEDARGQSPQHN